MPRTSRIAFAFAAAFLAACVLTAPALHESVQRVRDAAAGETDMGALHQRNAGAFAQILGEVRVTAADILFVKTEAYYHAGVAYKPHPKGEQPADAHDADPGHEEAGHGQEEEEHGQAEAGADGAHPADCAHGGVPTVIRAPAEDFRTFLGALERQVKPYLDPSKPHVHGDGAELLPWFRLMTLSNPRYIRGYRIGALELAKAGKWEQAVGFLDEGAQHNADNPQRFLLDQTRCMVYMRGNRNPDRPWKDQAVPRALEAARQACAAARPYRSPGGAPGIVTAGLEWSDDLEEDFRYAAHMVPLLLRELGRLPEALAAAREMNRLAPDYVPLRHTIEQLEKECGPAAAPPTPIGTP